MRTRPAPILVSVAIALLGLPAAAQAAAGTPPTGFTSRAGLVTDGSGHGADSHVAIVWPASTPRQNLSILATDDGPNSTWVVEGPPDAFTMPDVVDGPCTATGATQITCTVTDTVLYGGLEVWTGDHDDIVFVDGSQTITAPVFAYPRKANGGTQLFTGGPGNDWIDTLAQGDAGATVIEGGAGRDTYVPGPIAYETVSYDDNLPRGPMILTLDGYADDGDASPGIDGANEDLGPAVTGVDAIVGGPGDDVIHGGGGSGSFFGMDGDDIIDAGAATDQLFGGDGDDTLIGGPGNDWVYGDDEDAYEYAVGPHDPAGDGDDTIHLRDTDGHDTVYSCGGGADSVELDGADVDNATVPVPADCETVSRPSTGGTGGGGGGGNGGGGGGTPPPPPPPATPQPSPETVVVTMKSTTEQALVPGWVGHPMTTVDMFTPAFGGKVVYAKRDIVFLPKNRLPKNPTGAAWKEGMVVGQSPAAGGKVAISASKPLVMSLQVWGGPTKEQCTAEAAAFKGLELADFTAFMQDIGCKVDDVHVQLVKTTAKPREEDLDSGDRCEVGAVTRATGAPGRWLDATVQVPRDPKLQDLRLSVGNNPDSRAYPGLAAKDWALTQGMQNGAVIVRVQSRTGDPVNGAKLYFDLSGVTPKTLDRSFVGTTATDAKFGGGVFRMPAVNLSYKGFIDVLAVFTAKGPNGKDKTVCGTMVIKVFDRGSKSDGKGGLAYRDGDVLDTLDGRRFTFKASTGKMVFTGYVPDNAKSAGDATKRSARGLFDPIVDFFAYLFGGKSPQAQGASSSADVNRLANKGVILMQLANGKDIGTGAKGATIVAAGAGNLVGAGAGNLVGAGAGNIKGGTLVGAGAGNIVGAGAGNIVYATNGTGGLVGAGAGNLVGAGAGNIGNTTITAGNGVIYSVGGVGVVAAGAGNIVAAGAGNVMAGAGASIVAAGSLN